MPTTSKQSKLYLSLSGILDKSNKYKDDALSNLEQSRQQAG
jgi:hypothetical protein